ncbi:hypothetical protein RRG08_004852 [Elysia crispata]|uniref:Uncharacterized protein n=1 Tax=Elysia crispata TaxID=231223 RepID=A0AAE1E4G7_9GAST|nr:hypothetical protein RRG08_004852 [Elysia crispata]
MFYPSYREISRLPEEVGPGSAPNVPGGRLLQQASQHRRRVAGRLRSNHVPPVSPTGTRLPALSGTAAQDATRGEAGEPSFNPATLVSFLQSNALFQGLDDGRDAEQVAFGDRRASLGSRGSILSGKSASARYVQAVQRH